MPPVTNYNSPLECAREHLRHGRYTVPLPRGSKAPSLKGWQNLRIPEDDLPEYFGDGSNVGILLGEPSGGFTDIDLDAPEARDVASQFLPATGMVWGRKSSPASHYAYVANPIVDTKKFRDPTVKTSDTNDDKGMLIELRSTSCQSVAVGSVHPTGERYRYDKDGEPAVVEGKELLKDVAKIAASALLARHWPAQGSRQDAALASAGALLGMGWSEDDTEHFIQVTAEAAGDEEAGGKRVDTVAGTQTKLRQKKAVWGWPKLGELVGEDVAKTARQWLGGADLPSIVTTNRELRDVRRDALSALTLANNPERIFQRSNRLVRLTKDETGNAMTEVMDTDALRGELAACADWIKVTKEGRNHHVVPPWVASDIKALDNWEGIPPLRGLVRGPAMVTRAGDFLLRPGYDPVSGFAYVGEELNLPEMTVEQARAVIVDDLLGDFPFENQASRANAVSLLIVPFVRPVIQGPIPLYTVDAPTPGSGKGLLVDVCCIPSDAAGAAVMTAGKDDEEWRKRITAILAASKSYVLFDNVSTKLGGSALSGVITAWPNWEDRILGETRIIRLPNLAVWTATGNNLTFSQEMVRRAVWIRLVPRQEQPWLREGFRHPDLRGWARTNRGKLAGAVVVIVKAWVAAGKPHPKDGLPGSFERWAAIMHGILGFAGIEGFLDNSRDLYEQLDPQRQAWLAFIAAWWRDSKDRPVTTADLYQIATASQLLDGLVSGDDELAKKSRLGWAMRQRVDQIFGKHQIKRVAAGGSQKPEYRLERVEEK